MVNELSRSVPGENLDIASYDFLIKLPNAGKCMISPKSLDIRLQHP